LAPGTDRHLAVKWRMHRIETSRIKKHILSRYTVKGTFDPVHMSQLAIEDMCQTLSAGDWEALAA
jgi:hypothetical protein